MSVFPLLPGTKRPAVQRDWEGCATTDVEQIERWWHQAPYNIALATGPSRLVVVDLDAPHGPEGDVHGRQVLADLARKAGAEIPRETFTVATPRGWHLYFRAPEGLTLTNTVGRLGPQIDTRAVGGYVVGPGSRVGGRFYKVVTAVEPAPLPDLLVAMLRPVVPLPRSAPAIAHPRYVDAAVRAEARLVAAAVPGERNAVLF
ncbi:MAG: bifunctional DNA primase/polymerase, partial [Actinomycetota bacterium]|nr:bifunctional DNA primase/polymerase [Actinomycetota bacterium]